ncbi:MAG TPA: YihY/virulence factor BrkB family protein [Euzebyales bacterium]
MERIQQLLRAVDRFQQRHGVPAFVVGVVKKFGDDQGGKHAALLAYYGFVSLFPLLLVLGTTMAYVVENDPDLQQRVIDAVVAQFPVVGLQLRGSIGTIRGSGLGLLIGVLGTLWGGLGITQTAQDAMNAVWNVPRRDRPNFWLRLVRSGGVLLLAAAALFGATWLAGHGAVVPGVLGSLVSLLGSLLVNMVIVAALFRLLTAVDVSWLRLAPGAAVAAVAWSMVQALGVLIVTQQVARANLLYGVFAVVLVLLSWMLLTGRILIYAAEINVVLARRLWPRSLLQPPLTAQDMRALTALARTEQLRPEQHVEVTFRSGPDETDDPRPPG